MFTEHRALQEQYVQSQKLESLGTLAGGVAHDFNNLLTVINGYSNLLLRSLSEGDAVRTKIDQIHKAGEARGRAHPAVAGVQPTATKSRNRGLSIWNELVEDSRVMFRTLLGEDIELATDLSRPLGSVMADPGWMHQVLMNLLANARDAMPDGGRVNIRTVNITVSAEFEAEHPGVTPGPCVVLAVSDTGLRNG